MWIQVYGAAGTGKGTVVDLLKKRNFEHITFAAPEVSDDFENQLRYLVERTRVHLEAQAIMNRRDVVTIRGPYDTHEVFSKILLKQERITTDQFRHLEIVYNGLVKALEPPNATIYCHASPMSSMDRMGLKQRTINQVEFNEQLSFYKEFSQIVKVPQIECDFDQTMDVILREFEFNIASLKTTSVSGQTLWQRTFFRSYT